MPPIITPDAEGSKIAAFDDKGFVARIKMGRPSAEGSPMPWPAYAAMTDAELFAIWAYLQTVTRVDGDTGPVVLRE